MMLPDAVVLVDFAIGLTIVEGIVLAIWHRTTGRGIASADIAANLAAGLCLMLALRAALGGAQAWPIVLWVGAAGAAHALDLWRRGCKTPVAPRR